jgi:hypothetical protein
LKTLPGLTFDASRVDTPHWFLNGADGCFLGAPICYRMPQAGAKLAPGNDRCPVQKNLVKKIPSAKAFI